MDIIIITTSSDPSHSPTSTIASQAAMPARENYDRLFALYAALAGRTPDSPGGNVILIPLLYIMEERLAEAWDAGSAEELREIAAGRLPADARVFDGDNPFRVDGEPLPIQSGVPLPPENYWLDENWREKQLGE